MELKPHFCDDPCTFDQFKDYVDTIIPNDWDAECGNTQ